MRTFVAMTMGIAIILWSPGVQAQHHKNTVDIEKKMQMTGGTLAFDSQNNDNEETLLLGRRRDLESYAVSFQPLYGYFLADNFLVGGTVRYTFSKSNSVTRWEGGGIIGPPTQEQEWNRSVSHGFLVAPLTRYYIPLGKSGRAYLYVHVHLGVGYSHGEIEVEDTLGQVTSIPSDALGMELAFRPGFTLFVYEGFAFEVSIGSLGFSAEYEEIGEGENKSKTSGTNFDLTFDVDLMTIGFGLVGYF